MLACGMNAVAGRFEEGGVRLDQPSGWPEGQRVLVIALPADEMIHAGAPPADLLEEDARDLAPRRDALRT